MSIYFGRIVTGFVLVGVLSICSAETIQPDKRKHLEAGIAIGVSASAYSENYLYGIGLACAAGAAKEFYDLGNMPQHHPEIADLLATCTAGALSAYYLQEVRIGVSGDAPVIGISIAW